MLFDVRIDGVEAIIHHSVAGMLPGNAITAAIKDITSKRGTNKTESDISRLYQLETINALWLDDAKRPTVPPQAIRACIEEAARKSKQGPDVREGLVVGASSFTYDEDRYGTSLDDLMDSTQFHTVVVVQRSKVVRTRAKFDLPWSVEFKLDCDDTLVDAAKLERWLTIAGGRIGLGDWRPSKSGIYGKFRVASITSD